MLLRPKKRTLRSLVLRTLAPRLAVFGAGVAMLAVGQAMAVDPAAQSTLLPAERVAGAVPSWTPADASTYPGCVPSAAWRTGTPAGFVVVQAVRDGRHHKVAFDRAWQLNHDDTEVDDLWVIGVCG
jgi:hypothetical protein